MKKLLKILFALLFLFFLMWWYSLNYVYTGKGRSMSPTIGKNDVSVSIPFLFSSPKIGDIFSFICNEKCDGGRYSDIDTTTKRIIDINENGCYWVEGDNKEKSYDSRDFGWLCPEDIRIKSKTFAVIRDGKIKFIK